MGGGKESLLGVRVCFIRNAWGPSFQAASPRSKHKSLERKSRIRYCRVLSSNTDMIAAY